MTVLCHSDRRSRHDPASASDTFCTILGKMIRPRRMNRNRTTPPPARPSTRGAHALLLVALLCAACVPLGGRAGQSVAAATPVIVQPPPGTPARTFLRRLDGGGAVAPVRAGQPVRVKIPIIGVDAAVEQVGKTPDGAMDVPHDYSETAWYNLGPRPGEPGNAVIDGHVDSTTGKAVFWDLRKLTRGDRIVV